MSERRPPGGHSRPGFSISRLLSGPGTLLGGVLLALVVWSYPLHAERPPEPAAQITAPLWRTARMVVALMRGSV